MDVEAVRVCLSAFHARVIPVNKHQDSSCADLLDRALTWVDRALTWIFYSFASRTRALVSVLASIPATLAHLPEPDFEIMGVLPRARGHWTDIGRCRWRVNWQKFGPKKE